MRKTYLATVAMTVALFGATRASAEVLIDLYATVDNGTTYDLTFTATSSATKLTVEGYNLPGVDYALDNGVYADGSNPNLLQQTWDFAAGPGGGVASQFDDHQFSGANGLGFAGQWGVFDAFSQVFATTAGDSYTYHFIHTSDADHHAEFEVLVDPAELVTTPPGVPEPASWALMILGFGGLGAAARRKRTLGLQAAA